jgi:hypothetical protein
MPASFSKYSGGLIRLYGSRLSPGRPDRRGPCGLGSGRLPTSCSTGVRRTLEVRLDDPGVSAGLAIDGAGKPHDSRAFRARRVGDVRLAVLADPKPVNDAQVRELDRFDQLAARPHHSRRRQRLRQLPVGVHAARASALDEQVARALGQERPQRLQLAGLVDVDPQPVARADGVLVAARRGTRRRGEKHLLALCDVVCRELEQRVPPFVCTGAPA